MQIIHKLNWIKRSNPESVLIFKIIHEIDSALSETTLLKTENKKK